MARATSSNGYARLEGKTIDAQEKGSDRHDSARASDMQGDLAIILDKKGAVRFLTPSFCALLGYPGKSAIGKDFLDLVHPQEKNHISTLLDRVASRPSVSAMAAPRLCGYQGKWIRLESAFHSVPERNGGATILVNSRETSRARPDGEDSGKKNLLMETQRLARIGSWELDKRDDSVVWSEEMWHIHGRKAIAQRLTYDQFIASAYSKDQEMVRRIIDRCIKRKDACFFTHRILQPDGKAKILQTHGTVIVEDGKAIGMRGTCQDITRLKHVEEELRLSKLELEQRVLERTKRMSEVNAKLIRSLREKELLLNEIHHRVKNNLQVISSLVKLQLKKDPNHQGSVLSIQGRLKAIALVHEKLYESQDLSQIDFNKYVHDLFEYIRRSLLCKGSDMRLETDIESVYLDVNSATNLGLILNELISNAIKHGFRGKKEGVISVSMKRKDGYILRISNSGTPAEKIDLENPRTMGLTLVRSLVEQLDGRIEMNRNGSTEFVVRFPYEERWQTPGY